MGNLHLRRVELPDCPNLSKCNDNLPFTKGRQHGPNPAGGGLIGRIPWNLLEKRIEASFGGNSSHLNLTAPPSVPIAIAQTAGSLQEIHYPCVLFFNQRRFPGFRHVDRTLYKLIRCKLAWSKQKLSRPFLRVFPLRILGNKATLARFFTVPDQVS